MRKRMGTMLALLALVLTIFAAPTPAQASGSPRPDPAPQAHGRPVTILPNCPSQHLPWPAYVEELDTSGTVVCAGFQSPRRHAARQSVAPSAWRPEHWGGW